MKFRLTHEGSEPTTEDRCAHILMMIENIEQLMIQRAAGSYADHWQIALERMLEIIGVAASHIPDKIKQSADDVDWAIIAILDVHLAGSFARVDEAVLLDVASRMGPLKAFASRMSA